MTAAEIIRFATEWSNGEPELCAEIAVALDRIVREEREACAISCEVNAARWVTAGGKQWYAAHECAAAIRARGTP